MFCRGCLRGSCGLCRFGRGGGGSGLDRRRGGGGGGEASLGLWSLVEVLDRAFWISGPFWFLLCECTGVSRGEGRVERVEVYRDKMIP